MRKVTAASVVVAWELDARDKPASPLCTGEAVLALREVVELFKPIFAKAVATPETCEGPGFVIGWLIFVDR